MMSLPFDHRPLKSRERVLGWRRIEHRKENVLESAAPGAASKVERERLSHDLGIIPKDAAAPSSKHQIRVTLGRRQRQNMFAAPLKGVGDLCQFLGPVNC